MTTASLLAYAVALALAVATPGPSVLAVVSRGLAHGSRSALLMVGGVASADVVLGSLALAGLAALMATSAWLFAVMKYVGAAYLIWLGIRMWRAPIELSTQVSPAGRRDLLRGLAVGLSNPKAILFHASLMPLIVDLRLLDWPSAGAILAIVFAVTLSVLSGYALLASRGSGWFRKPKRLRWLSLWSGGSMVGAGAAIAAH